MRNTIIQTLLAILVLNYSFVYGQAIIVRNTDTGTSSGSLPAAPNLSATASEGIQIPKLVPPAPNAASLGQYGEVSTNLNSGQVSPSIPIYEIKLNDFSYPISLNYSNNGLKMSEVPSWVGLGWSLNAMGVINRQMRGIPDETTNGYLRVVGGIKIGQEVERLAKKSPIIYTSAEKDFIKSIGEFHRDGEPDLFFFNVGNLGGRFFFKNTDNNFTNERKTATSIPLSSTIVQGKFNYSVNNKFNTPFNQYGIIENFTIWDDTGVEYIFGLSDGGLLQHYDDEFASINSYNTWYLTKIITPNQNTIDFKYYNNDISEIRRITQPATFSQTVQVPRYSVSGGGIIQSISRFQAQVLDVAPKEIIAKNALGETICTVKFIEKETERDDWTFMDANAYLNPKPHALGKIEIYNSLTDKVKEYELNYVDGAKRLLLRSVQEKSETEIMPPHLFYYINEGSLPLYTEYATNSFSEDYWGYYNKAESTIFYPTYTTQSTTDGNIQVIIEGTNKQPNSEHSQIGMLKQIKYPTGGTSNFTYEKNTYLTRIDNSNICTGPYLEQGSVSVNMDNFDANNGIAYSEQLIVIPPTVQTANICLKIDYSISVGGLSNPDEITGSAYIKNENGKIVWGPKTLTAKRGQVVTPISGSEIKKFLEGGNRFLLITELVTDISGANSHTNFVNLTLSMNNQISPTIVEQEAGGNRIKTITTCPKEDNNNGCITKKITYLNESGISSGKILTNLFFDYLVYREVQLGIDATERLTVLYHCLTSGSQIPIATSGGNHIYYENVKVNESGIDLNGNEVFNGATKSNYTPISDSNSDYTDISVWGFPVYSPTISKDWLRGKVVSSSVIKDDGNTILKETINTYTFRDEQTLSKIALRFGVFIYRLDGSPAGYIGTAYGQYTGFEHPKTTMDKNYFYDKNYNPSSKKEVSQTTTFNYDTPTHYYLTSTSTTNSVGKTILKNLKYPSEIKDDASDAELQSSASKLFFRVNHSNKSTVLFTETKVDGKPVQVVKNYYNNYDTKILPSSTKVYLGSTLQSQITFKNYDTYGNLTEFVIDDGSPNAYLWGYNGQYLVSESKNATSSQILSAIGTSSLSSGGLSDIQENNILKINGALSTTYSYEPLIGIKTKADNSGQKMKYDYDGLGRLKNIYDNFGKRVKSYQYNYATPVASGTASSLVLSGQLNVQNSEIELRFNYPNATVSNYEIRRGEGSQPLVSWTTVPGEKNSVIDVNYNTQQNVYKYEVRAILSNGTTTEWKPLNINLPNNCKTNFQIIRNSKISAIKPTIDKACYEIILEEGFNTDENAEYSAEIEN